MKFDRVLFGFCFSEVNLWRDYFFFVYVVFGWFVPMTRSVRSCRLSIVKLVTTMKLPCPLYSSWWDFGNLKKHLMRLDGSYGKKSHEFSTGCWSAGTTDSVTMYQHFLDSRKIVDSSFLSCHLLVTQFYYVDWLLSSLFVGMYGYQCVVALHLYLLLKYQLLLTLLAFLRTLELTLSLFFGPVTSNLD